MSWFRRAARPLRSSWSRLSGRREFLANMAMAAAIVPGLTIAARYVSKFLVPGGGGHVEEILLDRLARFPVGTSRTLKNVLGNDLIAVRFDSGEVRVFSSVCTHLGCQVEWDPTQGNFLCPCHLGRFDPAGQVVEGPPPAPLPSFPVRIQADNVFVTVAAPKG